ncbi:MAG: hypothetical protein H6Q35_1380 [Proteobacteria bacterium]|nr:hypothetical protein [Pseudomonadota bacterium]
MAKSSIHIQSAKPGSVGHNSREHFSYSVVFNDEQNECSAKQDEAYKLYRDELKKRSEAYTRRVGQKLQKSTVTQLSCIVNLEQHHTLKDLEKIQEYLENNLGTKVFQMAIHRDEGKLISKQDGTELYSGKGFFLNKDDNKFYFDKKFTKEVDMSKYEIQKNYHAHIEMMGLDENGQAIRQKMNKVALQQLQTFTAETLNMERGQKNLSYTQEQMREITSYVGDKKDYNSTTLYAKKFNEVAKNLGHFIEKKKRKDTHDFKDAGTEREEAKRAAIAKERERALATEQKLKEEIARIREEYKAAGAIRADYAKLEQLNRDLKEKIKKRELTIDEFRNALQSTELYKEMEDTPISEIINSSPHPVLNMEKETVETKNGEIKEFYTNESVQLLIKKYTNLEMKAITQDEAIDVLEKEISRLSSFINKIKSFFNLHNLVEIYRKIIKELSHKPTFTEMDYAQQLKKEADTFLEEPLDTFLTGDNEQNKKGEAALEAMRVRQAERERKREESKAPKSKDDDKKEQRFTVKKR